NPSSETVVNGEYITGDICDTALIDELFEKYCFKTVYHLAAVLSAHAEKDPFTAFKINVCASAYLLEKTAKAYKGTAFVFPSSIAVYGVNPEVKDNLAPVKEQEYLNPETAYGAHKLSIELFGTYLKKKRIVDFKAIRFPGILSCNTLPVGGTSDFAPLMVHSAINNKPYRCFVSPDNSIPFLAMPDAVSALLKIAQAENLPKTVYNIYSFSLSSKELEQMLKKAYPSFKCIYEINIEKDRIVKSWPKAIDDRAARKDWGWSPKWDRESTIFNYLMPSFKEKFSSAQ
ncbi:MAG: NAD-dependent epimerase/dehydratase family protein, partial [Candidatus Dadabacteria bacterium]